MRSGGYVTVVALVALLAASGLGERDGDDDEYQGGEVFDPDGEDEGQIPFVAPTRPPSPRHYRRHHGGHHGEIEDESALLARDVISERPRRASRHQRGLSQDIGGGARRHAHKAAVGSDPSQARGGFVHAGGQTRRKHRSFAPNEGRHEGHAPVRGDASNGERARRWLAGKTKDVSKHAYMRSKVMAHGFSEEQAELSLQESCCGVEDALNWLASHEHSGAEKEEDSKESAPHHMSAVTPENDDGTEHSGKKAKQVLMVMDMQRDYDLEECRRIYGERHLPLDANDIASSVPVINEIRKSKPWDKVIFTQDIFEPVEDESSEAPRPFCVKGTPGAELLPSLDTDSSDLIFTKNADDAFNSIIDDTTKKRRFGLLNEGKHMGAKSNRLFSLLLHLDLDPKDTEITLVGRMLDTDVLKTSMHAVALGYRVVVVWDAVALTTGERSEQNWDVPSPRELGRLFRTDPAGRKWMYEIAASHSAAGTAFAYGYMEQAGISLIAARHGLFSRVRAHVGFYIVDLVLGILFLLLLGLLFGLMYFTSFRRRVTQILISTAGTDK